MARANGTARRVLARTARHGIEIGSWTRDGRRFAFFRRERDRAELVVTRGDGTHPRVLAHRARRVLTSARWSDDGRRLAFWDVLEDTTGHLVVVDTDTGRPRTVYEALEGAYSYPVGWTADGRTLVVLETATGIYPEELWTMRPDGTGLRRITSNKREEKGPAWSPDGASIAYWRDDPQTRRQAENMSVYVSRPDGSAVRKVVGGTRGSFASDPDWAPDGRSLAFVRWPDENHTDVWVIGIDGAGLRRLTRSGHSYAPAWTPDGRSITFSDDGAAMTVGLARGSTPSLLLDPTALSHCASFAWSPNGKLLAATCGIPGGVVLTEPGRGDLRPIEPTRSASEASWSPDGEWVVYQAQDGLRVVSASGGTTIPVELHGATASQPDWSPH